MSRKRDRVRVQLLDTRDMDEPSDKEIECILRAADMIIASAGRSMLVKILKGSKDKNVLEHSLDQCPSYGFYKHMKTEDVQKTVDWMIKEGYLTIEYSGRLPMIVFTEFGWEKYKPVFAREILQRIDAVEEYDMQELAMKLRTLNREIINIVLEELLKKDMQETSAFLQVWKNSAYKKDANNIRAVLRSWGDFA